MPPLAASQLPSEVWVHVFRLLSKSDKLRIRSCCKYFKRLVDHWSLWRNETVVLKKLCAYSPEFWTILRRRKTSSVVVRSASFKDWKQLRRCLPTLATIVIEDGFVKEINEILNGFPDLRSLSIRRCRFTRAYDRMTTPLQLTHFTVCEVCAQRSEIVNVVTTFSNLTSLSYHMQRFPTPKDTFHDILTHLPHLKHLSLRMGRMFGTLPDDYLCPGKQRESSEDRPQMGPALTSLEILDYTDPTLSQNAFVGLASLRSLAVFYNACVVDNYEDRRQATWLTSLPGLTSLSIIDGPDVQKYGDSVPGSLTSLTLRVKVETVDLQTLATRVPDLTYLHLEPRGYSNSYGNIIRTIPKLFPKLRTLKIRHQWVPESDLVSLQQLQHLERLEILDSPSQPSPLLLDVIQRLQTMTCHRIQVVHSPPTPNVLTCDCAQL
ncbi:uncharacterized protein im:7136021 isoform X1 [Hypomesus transpacificus]|uniref:uncharacterized protein im:7136021 isoform X1 n=1 Tax=Hypomesus transpacificus TaxID=137520 RepID=UPI001F075AA6|nr:uncharacterized protein im:7136021 isoform X1 [Hypomesus transpacificus]